MFTIINIQIFKTLDGKDKIFPVLN